MKTESLKLAIEREFGKNKPICLVVTGHEQGSVRTEDHCFTFGGKYHAFLSTNEIEGEPVRHCESLYAWVDSDSHLQLSRTNPMKQKVEFAESAFPLLKYFAYEHLPEQLQGISKPFSELAYEVALRFDNEIKRPMASFDETKEALRKLLEAKECAVRAALENE